jgi:hypothetical protein
MSRFHLELDENERMALILSLACKISSTPERVVSGEYVAYLTLFSRIVNLLPIDLPLLNDLPPSQSVMGASPATKPAPDPPGVPPPAPINSNSPAELVITPTEVEQSPDGKSMVVTYKIRTANATKTTRIRSWEPRLFGDLLATKGISTTFLVKESKGFLNIVGVKR